MYFLTEILFVQVSEIETTDKYLLYMSVPLDC